MEGGRPVAGGIGWTPLEMSERTKNHRVPLSYKIYTHKNWGALSTRKFFWLRAWREFVPSFAPTDNPSGLTGEPTVGPLVKEGRQGVANLWSGEKTKRVKGFIPDFFFTSFIFYYSYWFTFPNPLLFWIALRNLFHHFKRVQTIHVHPDSIHITLFVLMADLFFVFARRDSFSIRRRNYANIGPRPPFPV